jgi:hypothetical protein
VNLTIEIPILDKLKKATSQSSVDSLLRTIANVMLDETRFRIHNEGLNAKATQIGTYTAQYLKTRIKKYNRTADKKVILSLTGQMENDWKVIAVQGGYGLGFSNSFNANKAKWAQERFGTIYQLTPEEMKQIQLIINDWLTRQT